MTRGLLIAVVTAACADDTVTLAPLVMAPAAGSEADAFPDLDALQLSVALAGDDDDLVAARFERGQRVALDGVPYSDDLVVHLAGSSGGIDIAYGRTCAVDVRRDQPLAAPALYFARTVKWADVGAAAVADRRGGWAVAAADGSAVIGGGTDAAVNAATSVDRFDPRAGGFASLGVLAPRAGAVAAALGDGRIVVIGGAWLGAAPGLVEVIDPRGAGRIEQIDDAGLLLARTELAAAALSDGRVVAFGGRDGAGAPSAATVEVVTADGALAIRRLRAELSVARAGHSASRLSDDVGASVVIIGGVDAAGQPVAAAELYRPLRESYSAARPALNVPRSRHLAVRMPDGSLLVLGGIDGSGAPVRRMELFSLDGGFTEVGELPASAGVIDATASALPDGRILVTGGRSIPGGPALDTSLIARLDPLDGSVDVVATDRMVRPRAGHQTIALCDGTVLLVGGSDGGAPAERYNPPPLGRR